MTRSRAIVFVAVLLGVLGTLRVAVAQPNGEIEKRRDVSRRTTTKYGLQSVKGDAIFQIKNVDITHFPEMSVIFSAVNSANQFIRTLKKEDVIVLENGIARPILSLDMVSANNRVPIDLVFVIDQTASMGDVIGSVKQNVNEFANELRTHGFDMRIGLVRFSDVVEWVSPELTDDVSKFEQWVGDIQTVGGGDIRENALEGLHAVASMKLRPIAMRLAVLITDAQCHLKDMEGDGFTMFSIPSMGDYLYEREVKLVTITPKDYTEYHELANLTEGASFDLGNSFASVISGLVGDITSLYSLRYLSQSTLAPDSVRIDILRSEDKSPLASRKLLAMEPGRRFVFEDILFNANQSGLAAEFVPELERVVRLMHVRPTMRIQIEGHADSTGSADLNLKLSQERADAVKRYLTQSGIQPERIETIGYASMRPLAPNTTEAGRRLNRRIEFLILSK